MQLPDLVLFMYDSLKSRIRKFFLIMNGKTAEGNDFGDERLSTTEIRISLPVLNDPTNSPQQQRNSLQMCLVSTDGLSIETESTTNTRLEEMKKSLIEIENQMNEKKTVDENVERRLCILEQKSISKMDESNMRKRKNRV